MPIPIAPGGAKTYLIHQAGQRTEVAPERADIARRIDSDGDRVLSADELRRYLSRPDVDVLRNRKYAQINEPRVLEEYRTFLRGKVPASIASYHSYEQMVEKLSALAAQYPKEAKLVSLGKTFEGRDIWALKVTADVETPHPDRPGVVITGLHHAREWATGEIPLSLAETMLTGRAADPKMRERMDRSVTWVVPAVSPDGFTYSRGSYAMWRKNRRPITRTACDIERDKPDGSGYGIGVDPNRNYYDGRPENFYLYRPETDTPCSTWDDAGATSDSPADDTYRGPSGGSEAEVQAMLKLELDPAMNIKGVIDFHSYGQMILYPWSYGDAVVENKAEYLEVGKKMQAAMKSRFRLIQSSELYPSYGASSDFQHVHGILAMTLEMGTSFQPNERDVGPIVEDGKAASLALIDHIIARKTERNAAAK